MEKTFTRTISVLYRRGQAYLNSSLAAYDLTSAEYPFIIAILKNGGLTQDELSCLVCVDKSAAARVIKSLEQKGYVRRVQDKLDKRQNRVYITDAGEEIWPAVLQELESYNKALTQGVDADALEAAYEVLLKMEENAISLTGLKYSRHRGEGNVK